MYKNYASALSDAKQATTALYNPVFPLMTNLWCIGRNELRDGNYYAVRSNRAPEIFTQLSAIVDSLDVWSVEHFSETDYFAKYYTGRNFYLPVNMRQQAEITKWFLGGPDISDPIRTNLDLFWSRYVPKDYRVLSPEEIPCPKYSATAGVTYVNIGDDPEWRYLKKGPFWSNIQDGTMLWLMHVAEAVPDSWLTKDIEDLIGVRNPTLESLTVERPVIRTESGPGKVRWARASSANVYILGRMFMQLIQDGSSWSDSVEYIGKASNTQMGAIFATQREEQMIGTHGDDFIIYCPKCQRWHSGDWSNFDLHVGAKFQLSSYSSLYRQIKHVLSKFLKKLFYALAYLGIRARTLWPWDRKGEQSMSVRDTLGKVRSGSGDFVMHNNAMNRSALEVIFEMTHNELSANKYPCKSRRFWKIFSKHAKQLTGWVLKPKSQFSHKHGFVACRAIHTEERGFLARPTVSSVVRNWVSPSYDPEEFPNNNEYFQTARFREVNATLAWVPEEISTPMMDTLLEVAVNSGVKDPWGLDLDERRLGIAINRVLGQYSMLSYLES